MNHDKNEPITLTQHIDCSESYMFWIYENIVYFQLESNIEQ